MICMVAKVLEQIQGAIRRKELTEETDEEESNHAAAAAAVIDKCESLERAFLSLSFMENATSASRTSWIAHAQSPSRSFSRLHSTVLATSLDRGLPSLSTASADDNHAISSSPGSQTQKSYDVSGSWSSAPGSVVLCSLAGTGPSG